MPIAAAAQPLSDEVTDKNIAMVRNVIRDAQNRQAELLTRIERTWGWIDKHGAALPPNVLSELIAAIGPDPGTRLLD